MLQVLFMANKIREVNFIQMFFLFWAWGLDFSETGVFIKD